MTRLRSQDDKARAFRYNPTMSIEQSAGAVVFHRGKPIEFLLLFSRYWGFAKGRIEPGEDEQTAARREILEETGLVVSLLDNFRFVDDYWYQRHGMRVHKQAVYFLAQAADKHSKISWEHTDSAWLPFDQALARLNYEGGRQALQAANEFLLKRKT